MASTFFLVLLLAASAAAKAINVSTEAAVGRRNPDQYGPYYQGDMRFGENQLMETKSGLIPERFRWPNRMVPVQFDPSFTDSERDTVWTALWSIMQKTCIYFVTFDSGPKFIKDYVYVTKDKPGCWSYVGRQGGKQQLNMETDGCISEATAAHEFIHALGFFHEQSRPDRDQYVRILLENVKPDQIHNFDKMDSTTTFGVPYDYGSIMHYDDHAFSKNGEPTIIPLTPGVDGKDLGQRVRVSDSDAEKINRMYGCSM